MVEPRIEREIHCRQAGETLTERRVGHLPGRRPRQQARIDCFGPGGDMPDSPEAATASLDMRAQSLRHLVAERKVRSTDDAGTSARLELSSPRFPCDARHELRFAHGPQRFRTGAAITVAALHEHGRDDVMSGARIGKELVQKIAAAAVPQVVMGVDDRKAGFEYLLAVLAKPRRVELSVRDFRELGNGHAYAAMTGASPTTVVLCITRRSLGSNAVTWCMVQRLSHI